MKMVVCKCGCGKTFLPSRGRMWATKSCSERARYHAKKNGTWIPGRAKNPVVLKNQKVTCALCGKIVPKTTGNQKFCSAECRKTAKNIKRAVPGYGLEDKFCEFCGELIPREKKGWWQRRACYEPRCQIKLMGTYNPGPQKATHKSKKVAPMVALPDDWSHKKWALQQRELRKPNGHKCVVCGAKLTGSYRFRCKLCTARADDWMVEAGSDSGSMTGVFRSAAG